MLATTLLHSLVGSEYAKFSIIYLLSQSKIYSIHCTFVDFRELETKRIKNSFRKTDRCYG